MSATVALPRRPATAALDRRGLAALASGHLGADFCQGAVPALIPFLIRDRGLDYASAGVLVLVLTTTSSLLQPLFGLAADRTGLAWMAPAALLTGAGGLVLIVLSGSYGECVASVALTGVGVCAFHPEAARRANHASGSRRATGMSLFSVGGNAGFALAPAIITPLVLTMGMRAAMLAAAIPVSGAVIVATTMPHLVSLEPAGGSAHGSGREGRDRWLPFSLVGGVAASRSGVYFGLQALLPSFLIADRHFSTGAGNASLTVLLAAAAVGTLIGGRLSDRVGRLPVLLYGMIALPPVVLGLLLNGAGFEFVFAALIGLGYGLTFSGTVVLGQEYLPSRLGVAAAVTLGAAMGAGGLAAALLGVLGDSSGLTVVIVVIAALPIPGVLLTAVLRRLR